MKIELPCTEVRMELPLGLATHKLLKNNESPHVNGLLMSYRMIFINILEATILRFILCLCHAV